MSDDTPEEAARQVELTFHVYRDSLVDRGYGWEGAAAQVAILEPLLECALGLGFERALGKVRTLAKRMREAGREEAEVRGFLEVAHDFQRWRGHEVIPLTEERVAELVAMQGRTKRPVPEERTVHRVLQAIDRKEHQGLVDATAVYLAGYHALSAQDICRLSVSSWAPRAGQLAVVRSCVELLYFVSADEWLESALTRLVTDRERHEPLLANERGEALTPRRLQQRFVAVRDGIGSEADGDLTLERLRDHAARWMLENGATWGDLALAFGYTREASVRRRFGGEAWEYLADRDGNWFSIEAAGAVEDLAVSTLREWAESGMRHERRDGCVYVRKTDVREYGRRPVRSGRPIVHSEPPEGAEALPLGPAADALLGLFGASSAEEFEEAWERASEALPAPELPSAKDRFSALSEAVSPMLKRLLRLRQTVPDDGDAVARVSRALGGPLPDALQTTDLSFCGLRGLLYDTSAEFRLLDAGLRTVRDFGADSPVREGLLGLLDSVMGVDKLDALLREQGGAAAFWLLVDRYSRELELDAAAAGRYYTILDRAMEEVVPGCLLYTFVLSLLAANPATPLDERGPLSSHEDLMLEFVPRWLFVLLNAAGALPTGARGELLYAPAIRHIEDDSEFIAAFRRRWRGLEAYRRGTWSFRVLPAVDLRDIDRYRRLVFGRTPKEIDSVLSDALNHMLYLAKLPADRPLCTRAHSPAVSRWLVYVLHMPLVEAEYRAAVVSVADALRRAPRDLIDLTPVETPEDVYNTCMSAVESFDYRRGAHPGDVGDAGAPGTAFARYLRARARRYFASMQRRLRASGLQSASSAPGALERHFAGSPDTWGATGGAAGGEGVGGDADVAHMRLRLERPCINTSMLCPVIIGPGGEVYVSAWWAGKIGGKSTRWVQLHARELGAVTAAEVFSEERDLLAEGLEAQQYLIPYDEGLAERIHSHRARSPNADERR